MNHPLPPKPPIAMSTILPASLQPYCATRQRSTLTMANPFLRTITQPRLLLGWSAALTKTALSVHPVKVRTVHNVLLPEAPTDQ
jgi:hypothetical protein